MSILSSSVIRDRQQDENDAFSIDPFDEDQLQPASYDIRLGNSFEVFQSYDINGDLGRSFSSDIDPSEDPLPESVPVKSVDEDDVPPVITPNKFILGTTQEEITVPTDCVAKVEGRSSLGRLGLIIHSTAGFIDPGFQGQITLEMSSIQHTICLKPGMRIGQLVFHTVKGEAGSYDGKYQNQEGPTMSRIDQDSDI